MAGMNGMTMMMKSFGLDPEEIKKNIEEFKTEITARVTETAKRLENLELQCASILAQNARMNVLLERILAHQSIGPTTE